MQDLQPVIQFQIACICGAMRFKSAMIDVARELTKNGFIVVMPFVDVIKNYPGYDEGLKIFLDEMHRAKIRMSDVIYVVDCELPGMPIYIGESTQKEIDYAAMLRKEVGYYSSDEYPKAI